MSLNAGHVVTRRFRKKRCVYAPANTRDDAICFLRVSAAKCSKLDRFESRSAFGCPQKLSLFWWVCRRYPGGRRRTESVEIPRMPKASALSCIPEFETLSAIYDCIEWATDFTDGGRRWRWEAKANNGIALGVLVVLEFRATGWRGLSGHRRGDRSRHARFEKMEFSPLRYISTIWYTISKFHPDCAQLTKWSLTTLQAQCGITVVFFVSSNNIKVS